MSDKTEQLLVAMGFDSQGEGRFTKHFPNLNVTLEADTQTQKLTYPSEIGGRTQNLTFTPGENIIVFECVNRLLSKGYRPQDIVLEETWQLGHNPKSGRADICVHDESGSVLFIIECKTWGREFEKAMKDTLNDGGQLFSYWQQESSAKWLVLYTSTINDKGELVYRAPTINCSDDPNLTARAVHDDSIRLYESALSAKTKHEVWRDTYNLELHDDVIFSPDSLAYKIGLKPLRKRDLKPFDPHDKIVNKFEEILRHNNVSNKETAFNRLIALFICKLVDELTKGENDELDFQYKHRTDSYESLQDRLQRLYTEGMKEFMHERIAYVPDDYPERLFSNYTSQKRSEAIAALRDTFRVLKYYSNNDFAFKDVHNEELFYQNSKILVEVVQLFERYRIVQTDTNQFLGDLFEQLLDKGFKQNEGQFFTPMPITRFIWDCLPLRRFKTWPRVIDYACGAGHFLIEAVKAINHFIPSSNNSWVRDCIYGIEKDDRLARVSKVSMFMNGAGESSIIFGDGLENSEQIVPGTFDILTANPPYSIASFSQHLKLKSNEFTLLSRIGTNGSEIEVLFVERIAQLLVSGGIAAVILPSSILSNDSMSYTGAREEILRRFKIRAIVQFGSKTFGATGTNTVVMFLERYAFSPERYRLVHDSADSILDGRNLDGWEDKEILDGYLTMQGMTIDDWRAFTDGETEPEHLHEYFRMYHEAFKAKRESQRLSPEEYHRRFYEYARRLEHEKLRYYGLTYSQRTVVIIAPSDNAGQKEFLGYDWSNRKGDEGIKHAVKGGKLFDPNNREADGTLASLVRESFNEGEVRLSEDNRRYARVVRTSEMLDFSRLTFNKAIRLREKKDSGLDSRYSCVKLGTVARMNIPKSEAKPLPDDMPVSFLDMSSLSTDGRILTMSDRPLGELWSGSYSFFREGDILVAKMMTSAESLKCAIAEGLTNGFGFGSSEFYTFRCGEEILTRYVCEFLNTTEVRESAWASVTGTGRLRVPARFYETLNIPLPPMSVQADIVRECEAIDASCDSLRLRISQSQERIESIFRELEALPPIGRLSLDDKRYFTLMIGRRVLNSELIDGGRVPVFSANVHEPFGYVDGLLKGFEDFGSDSILWGIDGDFMVSYRARGYEFYPTDHCGVLRVLTERVNPRYMARVLLREGMRAGFSRSYRASLDRVGRITFGYPDTDAQDESMREVLRLEGEVLQAKRELESLSGMKESVLKRYLQ